MQNAQNNLQSRIAYTLEHRFTVGQTVEIKTGHSAGRKGKITGIAAGKCYQDGKPRTNENLEWTILYFIDVDGEEHQVREDRAELIEEQPGKGGIISVSLFYVLPGLLLLIGGGLGAFRKDKPKQAAA